MPPDLFNPQILQNLCRKFGLIPSKKYGQNFLISPEPIEKMMEAGELDKDDTVVEVGPGFGVLTLALAEKVKKVTAFEIEKKLEKYWEKIVEIKKLGNLEIVWGNVLKILNLKSEISKYKVIANLPYQITSPVIRLFLEAENPPELMVLMVQKEVAERICAKPGDMSLLSVSVQYYAEPEIVAYVPKENFWPIPKVDSAIVKMRIKNDELRIKNDDRTRFFNLVKKGFANRRKLLFKNLLPFVGKENKLRLKEAFADVGLTDNARAQELSMEQWVKLADYLKIQKLKI